MSLLWRDVWCYRKAEDRTQDAEHGIDEGLVRFVILYSVF